MLSLNKKNDGILIDNAVWEKDQCKSYTNALEIFLRGQYQLFEVPSGGDLSNSRNSRGQSNIYLHYQNVRSWRS